MIEGGATARIYAGSEQAPDWGRRSQSGQRLSPGGHRDCMKDLLELRRWTCRESVLHRAPKANMEVVHPIGVADRYLPVWCRLKEQEAARVESHVYRYSIWDLSARLFLVCAFHTAALGGEEKRSGSLWEIMMKSIKEFTVPLYCSSRVWLAGHSQHDLPCQ